MPEFGRRAGGRDRRGRHRLDRRHAPTWPRDSAPGSIRSPGWTASPRRGTNPCGTPRGDWIFWLDGDERLDEENRDELRTLLAGLKDENAAYVMSQRLHGRAGVEGGGRASTRCGCSAASPMPDGDTGSTSRSCRRCGGPASGPAAVRRRDPARRARGRRPATAEARARPAAPADRERRAARRPVHPVQPRARSTARSERPAEALPLLATEPGTLAARGIRSCPSCMP